MLNDTVSIIVPIYNKEKYLEKCLDSILGQTYRDLEIILVDDGSTDNSLAICQHYAEKDPRIKIYHKPNGGVSSARNLGLEKSTGTLISFADPDDSLHAECIERLKRVLDETGAEIAYCYGLDLLGTTGRTQTKSDETEKISVMPVRRYDWNSRKAHTVCWGAVYRRAVTQDVAFDTDLKIGEDTLFLAKCIRKAEKIACIDKALYYYYVNDDSVTSGHYSAGKLTELKAWQRICKVFADEPFVYRSARAGYALRCREIVVKYCKDDAFMEQACAEAEREFKRNAGPLLAGWFRAGQYRYFIKTLYSYLLWNSWLKKKQARKTYEVEI